MHDPSPLHLPEQIAGRMRRHRSLLLVVWTTCVLLSLAWFIHKERKEIFSLARTQARIAYEKDVTFRKWNTLHGGVYVPVTEETQPSPFIHTKERDVTTPSGRQLTLINHAMMTRQVYDLTDAKSGLLGHITGLHPLRPANAPDQWEKVALSAFSRGENEVSDIVSIGTTEFMRLMRPLYAEQSCLACHDQKLYAIDDLLGGISVAVNMAPFREMERTNILTDFGAHLLLWLIGTLGVLTSSNRLHRQIQEKFAAESQLRQSEAGFRSLLANLPHLGLIGFSTDGTIRFWNQASEQIFSYSEDEAIGRNFLDLVCSEENRGDFILAIQELLDGTAIPLPMETSLTRKDHSPVPVYFSLTETNQLGNGQDLFCFIVDLTQPKHAELERERLERQLVQAQKLEALGTLAGGIAHDFNNILGAIFGCTDLALLDAEKNSSQQECLLEIKKAGDRAKDLVAQILHFSRQTAAARLPVRLSTVAKECIRLLRASLPATITIEEKITNHEVRILADATQIHQIIMNLCTNAAQSMSKNGGTITISLSLLSLDTPQTDLWADGVLPGDYQLLTVSDTGCGMSREVQSRIFEPFFTTKPKDIGTGLGLSVVHGIVQNHGGAIRVTSNQGQGSAFHIIFPKVTVDTPPVETLIQDDLAHGSESILFVDDETALTRSGRLMLEFLGYTVTTAANGREALSLFENQPDSFALIFTDHTMPRMTGSELIQRARAIRPQVAAILYTGYVDISIQQEAHEIGADMLLHKPLSLRILAKAVRETLDRPKTA